MKEDKRGYKLEDGVIVINRELTYLDIFVKDFLEILKQYTDYLVVSGFVSVCCGRARGTEDIDIIVPLMNKFKFKKLFDDLQKNYWCYQGDNSEDVYSYICNLSSIRFAKVNEMFPNIEFIPFDKTKKAKSFEFDHPQKIRIKDFEFKIPPIEFEILYKERVLKGDKDIADAKHLRTFFLDLIREEKFKEYEGIINTELK
ncbi:MAG: hypothetical protein ISS82_05435 [Nanoarchaeota archaeon]|nr:hypothetical protein [Nanoarchaeota archaeon]